MLHMLSRIGRISTVYVIEQTRCHRRTYSAAGFFSHQTRRLSVPLRPPRVRLVLPRAAGFSHVFHRKVVFCASRVAAQIDRTNRSIADDDCETSAGREIQSSLEWSPARCGRRAAEYRRRGFAPASRNLRSFFGQIHRAERGIAMPPAGAPFPIAPRCQLRQGLAQ